MHRPPQFVGILGSLLTVAAATASEVPLAVDENPDPNIFETTFVAEIVALDLDGNGLMADCWTFNGSRPGPEIRAKVGDTVIVHLENALPAPTSIHWHGIEVANPADGTSVTQAPVMPGETFTYRFVVPRPGQFYYHPHMKPLNQVFKGMYGSVVVTEEAEETLTNLGVLPERDFTLVLSDVTVARPVGENDEFTYPDDPSLPWAGPGKFSGNFFAPTPFDLVELFPRTNDGTPSGAGPVPPGTIPNIAPALNCGDTPDYPCRTNEGQHVLGNGRVAAPRAGSPEAPGAVTPAADALTVASGRGVRLRLLNAAVSRYFRLRATDADGNVLPLYRIGGEGGLLNTARLEGGMQGDYDTEYDEGEIVIGPSQRADVVLVADVPAGDVITLWTLDFRRAGFGWARLPSVPVMHIVVGKADGTTETMSAGQPLRTDPAVNDPIPSLAERPLTGTFLDPAAFDSPRPGLPNTVIRLTNLLPSGDRYPSIDLIRGAFEGGGTGVPPYIESTRWARVGDLLELVIRNETQAHHPWHHHGFSFQPLRLEDLEGNVLREYHTEFLDVVDVPGRSQIVYRMELEDRVQADGVTTGGAIGRWLFHCHLFHHASLGMITDLVVLPPCAGDADADGTVNTDDLLLVLGAWGTRSAAADANLDGRVDFIDLLSTLSRWGACD